MTDESIAIVGASCRFPGADNLEGFWQLLASGGDAISEVDDQRWSTRFYYHPNRAEPGKSYTWAAGLVSGADLFEPSFFGISPREAAQMDPQQRLLLELVWHAFEDAGIPPSKFSGSSAGVYIGASATDYSDLRLGDPAGADSYFMTGSTLSILANRISYVFDLRGPSLAVDTACSSSLVAMHHACEAIRGKRIASAVVGGINLLLAPYPFIGFSRASMLSRRGRCFAFDERADGYVRGEGGGVMILKPLAIQGFGDRELDLRVDEHRTPFAELRRILNAVRSGEILSEANARLSAKDLKGALEKATAAREKSPTNDSAWVALANIHLQMGQRGEALSAIGRAVELNPANKRQLQSNKAFEALFKDPDFLKIVSGL